MTATATLERRLARIAAIEGALGILGWDTQTMMPEGAAEARAGQTATLSVIAHELLTDPRLAEDLAGAEAEAGLDPWRTANLRETRRWVTRAHALPGDLVEATSRAVSACEMRWRSARADNDFAGLLPSFKEVLARTRECAEAKGEALGLAPYDALLDEFDPGSRTSRVEALFDDLADFLPGLLARALAAQAAAPPVLALEGPFPVAAQRALGERLMRQAGFDFTRGRLDVSLHPFCGGSDDDVRITTRYDEDDFARALLAVLHETGHGLYEQNRPSAWRGQPVGHARGMAIHESQSLIMEMQACRTPEFLGWLAPLAAEAFAGRDPAWAPDNLIRLNTRVAPGFIRVDADEVTYPAHVILRFRLERAMLSGDLLPDDLPGAWNEGMRTLLGLTPPDDRRGCLQDIHWPGGSWGYFPTYTLGAMAAAQLFDAARTQRPELPACLAKGDFAPLVAWLAENVHAQGCLPESADALLTQATGRPLDASVFKRHLETRYALG